VEQFGVNNSHLRACFGCIVHYFMQQQHSYVRSSSSNG